MLTMNIDDLEKVSGGVTNTDQNGQKLKPNERMHECPGCKDPNAIFVLGSGGRAVCKQCNTQIML